MYLYFNFIEGTITESWDLSNSLDLFCSLFRYLVEPFDSVKAKELATIKRVSRTFSYARQPDNVN